MRRVRRVLVGLGGDGSVRDGSGGDGPGSDGSGSDGSGGDGRVVMGRVAKGGAAMGWAGTGWARMGQVGMGQEKMCRLGTGLSGTGRSRKRLQWTLLLLTGLCCFWSFGGHLEAIWVPKKIHKGSQVEGMFGQMSEHKD
jgi:hypothetical protein